MTKRDKDIKDVQEQLLGMISGLYDTLNSVNDRLTIIEKASGAFAEVMNEEE